MLDTLCHINTKAQKYIFADGTTLFIAGLNMSQLSSLLESDLKLISDWLEHNRLLLKIIKSNAMIFKWKHQRKMDALNTNIDV